jgi:hypothetical protein
MQRSLQAGSLYVTRQLLFGSNSQQLQAASNEVAAEERWGPSNIAKKC